MAYYGSAPPKIYNGSSWLEPDENKCHYQYKWGEKETIVHTSIITGKRHWITRENNGNKHRFKGKITIFRCDSNTMSDWLAIDDMIKDFYPHSDVTTIHFNVHVKVTPFYYKNFVRHDALLIEVESEDLVSFTL